MGSAILAGCFIGGFGSGDMSEETVNLVYGILAALAAFIPKKNVDDRTRMTIATTLAITFISSVGSTAGKLMTGQVMLWPAVIMVVASLIASPLGTKGGQKMNVNILQWLLAVLIAGTAVKIWLDIL